MKVFIVEDALFLREMLCRVLTEKGLKVAGVADSVAGALPQIKRLKPDLVLVDLVLPGQNGLALLQELQQNHKTKALVCSSLPREKAGEEGVAGYVQKPFDVDELMSTVFSTLGIKTLVA